VSSPSQPHHERAAQHQEQLILPFVIVPVEGALQFGELHVLTIELANHPGMPVVGE
jgi:hypothetical protein